MHEQAQAAASTAAIRSRTRIRSFSRRVRSRQVDSPHSLRRQIDLNALGELVQSGGMESSDAKRPRDLEAENNLLKSYGPRWFWITRR